MRYFRRRLIDMCIFYNVKMLDLLCFVGRKVVIAFCFMDGGSFLIGESDSLALDERHDEGL